MNKIIIVLLMLPMVVMGQEAPYECDNNYGECGTPETSGGGNAGGGGSILIANSDLGDTYQSADDYDDDGVEDSYDNCPRKPNADQSNVDGDEEGDACDRDIDGDGLDNLTDPCPMRQGDPTEDTEWCSPDTDGDGIPDYGFSADNCPGVHNPEQWDTDLDGSGDACDPDLDGDGVGNLQDNCNGVFNHDQIDADRDGKGDEGCDDHYCFVVFGDEENCLDPEAGFRVYSPDIAANTGDTVNLRLFMNRQDTNAEYTWSVRSRPGRSSASIDNPIGTVDESSLFDHIYEVQPTFVPDIPGEYILVIEVVGKFTEERTVAYATVQHEVRISVSGVPISTAGSGCSTLATQGPVSILWLIFMFFGYLIIQRKRSVSIGSYNT